MPLHKRVNGLDLNDYVAHRRDVLTEVRRTGRKVQATAEGHLAPHTKTGAHQITGGPDGITDYYVYLDGPRAYNVEYGRAGYTTDKYQVIDGRLIPPGTHIAPAEGLHVLRKTYNETG